MGSSVEFVASNEHTLTNNKTVSDKEVVSREVFGQSAVFARFDDDGVLQGRAVVYVDKVVARNVFGIVVRDDNLRYRKMSHA